ncbi:MAG TPA: RNA polymerase sigma factor [Solirubrobacteraceae bacterium]|nr:RNA polymerase sigma factor [Solirubrobacteraceae bacterium]
MSQERAPLVYLDMRMRSKRPGTTPDGEAFGLFYDRHVDAVLAYFRRRTADAELALDLTAETFARVLAATPREPLPSGAAATALLFAVARNLLIDSYRRGRVDDRARRSLALEPLVLTDHGLERVEEAAVAGESRIAELLAELPEAQREAIVARVVEEQPYPAIAAALRCSESVVRKRVSRGLSTLRARIVEEEL